MRRLGRTVVSDATAGKWSYKARTEGSDRANLAGDCERPVIQQMTGLEDKAQAGLRALRDGEAVAKWSAFHMKPVYVDGVPQEGRLRHIDIEVPCRKCPACLRRRAAHWRLRATAETTAGSRTWFSTFTVRPELHANNLYRIMRLEAARGNAWDKLTGAQRWDALCRWIVREWQLYIKRLRKSGANVRYLMVIERHTGGGPQHGMPHLHALIHEQGAPVTYRVLTDQWPNGFSTHKLVKDNAKAVSYVCKYLTKDVTSKPRASLRYGTV